MDDKEIPASVEKWVGADVVAKHLGFKEDHVRKLARAGIIPAFCTPQLSINPSPKRAKRQNWRFKLSQVDRALEELTKKNLS